MKGILSACANWNVTQATAKRRIEATRWSRHIPLSSDGERGAAHRRRGEGIGSATAYVSPGLHSPGEQPLSLKGTLSRRGAAIAATKSPPGTTAATLYAAASPGKPLSRIGRGVASSCEPGWGLKPREIAIGRGVAVGLKTRLVGLRPRSPPARAGPPQPSLFSSSVPLCPLSRPSPRLPRSLRLCVSATTPSPPVISRAPTPGPRSDRPGVRGRPRGGSGCPVSATPAPPPRRGARSGSRRHRGSCRA